MDRIKIIELLDELFENEKSRGFFNHLVKAYFPVTNVDKIFIKPNGVFKCSLTSMKLISVNEVLNTMVSKEYQDEFMKYLHTMLNSDVAVETPITKMLEGKVLGVQGSKTDTVMGLNTYHVFQEWIANKILHNDKHSSYKQTS